MVWDLRYSPPVGARRDLSIAAVYRNTPTAPVGPFVHPGRYTVRLTADGVTMERRRDVRMDPRVVVSDADLRLQTDLSLACYRAYQRVQEIREALDAAVNRQADRREQLMALRGSGTPENPDILYESISAADPNDETVVGVQQKLLFMLNLLQAADARPTSQAEEAVRRLTAMVPLLEQRWAQQR